MSYDIIYHSDPVWSYISYVHVWPAEIKQLARVCVFFSTRHLHHGVEQWVIFSAKTWNKVKAANHCLTRWVVTQIAWWLSEIHGAHLKNGKHGECRQKSTGSIRHNSKSLSFRWKAVGSSLAPHFQGNMHTHDSEPLAPNYRINQESSQHKCSSSSARQQVNFIEGGQFPNHPHLVTWISSHRANRNDFAIRCIVDKRLRESNGTFRISWLNYNHSLPWNPMK